MLYWNGTNTVIFLFKMGKIKLRDEVICPRPSGSQGLNLFPKAQSGAPAKRHQYLWPVYFKCFPTNKWSGPAGERVSYGKMGKLYASRTEPSCKTIELSEKYLAVPRSSCHPQGIARGSISGLGDSRIMFITDACRFFPFLPCNRTGLSSLSPQLQRQEKNVFVE